MGRAGGTVAHPDTVREGINIPCSKTLRQQSRLLALHRDSPGHGVGAAVAPQSTDTAGFSTLCVALADPVCDRWCGARAFSPRLSARVGKDIEDDHDGQVNAACY